MTSAFKLNLPTYSGSEAIKFNLAINGDMLDQDRKMVIQHNLNSLYPIVNFYRPDGTSANNIEYKIVDSNSISIQDYNGNFYSDFWNISVMSGGAGNAPVSLPAISTDTQVFGFEGVVKPVVGTARWYPDITSTITSFYASIEVAPTSPVVLQLKKNGIAVGTTIALQAGDFKSLVSKPNIDIFPEDYITVDIVSGDSGTNVHATVVLHSSPMSSASLVQTPKATSSDFGLIKIGSGLNLDTSGKLNVVKTNTTVFEDNHDFQVSCFGPVPIGAPIGMHLASKAYVMKGGYARALSAPTNAVQFTVTVNGTPSAIIRFEANSNVGYFKNMADESVFSLTINAGDLLQVIAPMQADPTLADVAIVVGGSGAIALALPAATRTSLGLVKIGSGLSVLADGTVYN